MLQHTILSQSHIPHRPLFNFCATPYLQNVTVILEFSIRNFCFFSINSKDCSCIILSQRHILPRQHFCIRFRETILNLKVFELQQVESNNLLLGAVEAIVIGKTKSKVLAL